MAKGSSDAMVFVGRSLCVCVCVCVCMYDGVSGYCEQLCLLLCDAVVDALQWKE